MATKDSGERGSRKQPSPRRTSRTRTGTGTPDTGTAPAESETRSPKEPRRRTRAETAQPAAEPQATAPKRRARQPRPAGAERQPRTEPTVSAEAPATETTAEPRPPVPVTAAPEAAATGSPEPVAATLPGESLPPTELTSEVTGYNLPPTEAPPEEAPPQAPVPDAALAEAVRSEERAAELTAVPGAGRTGRRERTRVSHSNALGVLIERHFSDPMSPCRSYSDLERRSGISREALSRYVTSRADRRRSPTIDTLVAIADAMHLSLEAVCRAAAASVKGMPLVPEEEQHAREEVLSALVVGLTDQQFSAIVELLRHLRPVASTNAH